MKIVAVIIAVLVLAGYIGFQVMYPSATIHYRLTLAVDTPEGTKTGSSVIEVTYAKALGLFGNNAEVNVDVKGEAVAVDLGNRGVLFALLMGRKGWNSWPERIVLKAFGFKGGTFGSPPDAGIARLRKLHCKAELSSEELPLLVRFRDIKDSKSVERVYSDDLAASFGPGVRLARASIEITDEPVTTGITKRLWWPLNSRAGIWGVSLPGEPRYPIFIGSSDFRRGFDSGHRP